MINEAEAALTDLTMIDKITAEKKSNTAQLCVLDNRLARAWMQ